MPAPSSVQEFVEVCLKSGVVDEAQLKVLDRETPSSPTMAAKTLVRTGALTKFQASQLLAGKYKGLRFDRLKILDRIGSGGMGTVFLCEHLGLRKNVAVKVLPPDMANDVGTRERFFREARAAAVLDHPNIVRVFDMNQSGGVHYIVMEYVEGQDIQSMLNKYGPFPHTKACTLIAQAALGLQHAHDKGLVHRDIKPANLLVDKEGVVKILDMGLARFEQDANDNLTARYDKGAVLGTADFMAPEQVMSSSTVDIRADIYALGVTLYTMINGKPPFGGSSTQKLVGHQTMKATSLTAIRREVPKALSAVVDRMIAKNPDDRFQTPAEVVDALTPWLEAETVSMDVEQTRKHTSSIRSGKLLPKKQASGLKPFLLIGGAGILLAAVGLAIYLTSGDDKKPATIAEAKPTPPAVIESTNTENPPVVQPPVTPEQTPEKNPPVQPPKAVVTTIFDANRCLEGSTEMQPGSPNGVSSILPSEWNAQVWKAGSKSRLSVETHQGLKAAALFNLEGDPASQLMNKADKTNSKLKARQGYRLNVEYATKLGGTGRLGGVEVRFGDLARPSPINVSLFPTNGQFKTATLAFRAPVDGPLSVFISHSGKPNEDTLLIRSVTLEDAASATRDPLSDDFSVAEIAKLKTKGGFPTESTGRLPLGYTGTSMDGNGISEFTVERIDERSALTVRALEGGPASALLNSPRFAVDSTREYRVEFEYQAGATSKGTLKLDDGVGRGRWLADLPSTNGEWKTMSLPFWPFVSTFYSKLEFENLGTGKENRLAIRWLAVRDNGPAVSSGTSPLLQLKPDATKPLKLRLVEKKQVEKVGQLPAGYDFQAWDDKSTLELEVGEFEGSTAFRFLSLIGKPSGMFFTPYLPNPAGQEYELRIEYYGTSQYAAGSVRVQVLGTPGTSTVGELNHTNGKWRELRTRFRPIAGEKFRLEIFPQASGTDKPLLIRSLEIRPYQATPEGTWITLSKLDAGTEKPFRMDTIRGAASNSAANVPLPAGWNADSWREAERGSFSCENYRGRPAFTLLNQVGSSSIQFFTQQPIANLRKGETCIVKIVVFGEEKSKGVIEHRTTMDGAVKLKTTELGPTDSTWKVIEVELTPMTDCPLYTFIQNQTSGMQTRLAIASYEVMVRRNHDALPPPKISKVVEQIFWRFDVAKALESMRDLDGTGVLRDANAPAPNVHASMWKSGDTGKVGVIGKEGRKSLSVQNVTGNSAQAWTTTPKIKAPANRRLMARVKYSLVAEPTKYGYVDLRLPKTTNSVLKMTLLPTGLTPRVVEYSFEAPTDEQIYDVFIQPGIEGPSEIMIDSVEILAARAKSDYENPVYQLDLSNQKPFAQRFKGKEKIDSQGQGDLPNAWQGECWKADATCDFFAEEIGGVMAIGLRNHEGTPSAVLQTKQPVVLMQPGKRYSMKWTYQTEANARGSINMRTDGRDIFRMGLAPSVGKWSEAEMIVTANAAEPMRLNIVNSSQGSDSSIHIRGIEVRELK